MIFGELDRIGEQVNRYVHRNIIRNNGDKIMQRDWDNLIILDGCRYDLFAESNHPSGELTSIVSRGSQSLEFLRENFEGEEFYDTIYITANPYVTQLEGDIFYEVVHLYDEYWNDKYQTVLPEEVVKKTQECYPQYKDKRIIVHFMQPHIPFIGQVGESIPHIGMNQGTPRGFTPDQEIRTIWTNLRYNIGGINIEEVWEAYRENLTIVLEHVGELLQFMEGKSVITSDHGNLVGDWLWPVPVRGYGHPPNLRVRPLVKVPWLEVDFQHRRSITKGEPANSSEIDGEVITQRLAELGYV